MIHIGITGPIYLPSINTNFKGDKSNWPKGMGGVPVNHLINALLELGFKISVFSSSPEIEVGNSFEWHQDNLSIYIGPHRAKPRYCCKDFFAVESNYIKNVILKANPDFIHAHWQYEWALGALKSGFKTLITCHDSPIHVLKAQKDLYRFYRLIMAIYVLRKAKYLTTVSDHCLKGLKKICSKNIKIVPNFESDFVFNFYKKNKQLKTNISIVMINNGFTSLKNVKIGILAFVQFRQLFPEAELHLYGKSYSKNEEAYLWSKSRVDLTNILFHGQLPFELLMNQLSEKDLLLHTSLEESFGMVITEAMAMGIPVIAGENSGGPAWILKDGGGLLIDVNSVKEVKEALIKLMNPLFFKNCSKMAREIAINRFSKNQVVKLYLEEYQILLNSKL